MDDMLFRIGDRLLICSEILSNLAEKRGKMKDAINPEHYRNHPSGMECIDLAEHFNYNLGNVIKYVWRSGKKEDRIQDLEKAAWYLNREISRLKSQAPLGEDGVPTGGEPPQS